MVDTILDISVCVMAGCLSVLELMVVPVIAACLFISIRDAIRKPENNTLSERREAGE